MSGFCDPSHAAPGPVVAWVVDDTGFPKKGRESVGVARQYCGQVGKQDNCRVAVSLSVTTEKASMPVAYRLYLPKSWIEDRQRRKKTGVPESIQFQTKPEIALEQIRRAVSEAFRRRGAGRCRLRNRQRFRAELTKLEMAYVMGIEQHDGHGLETGRGTDSRRHAKATPDGPANCYSAMRRHNQSR